MDRCTTLEERVGVEGDEYLMDEGDEKEEDEEIELEKAETVGEWVIGSGGVVAWGLEEVVSSGADQMVKPQRHQRRRRQDVV